MNLPSPLLEATFLRRYKRFLADFSTQEGEEITAHCANSGSMLGLLHVGEKAMLSHATTPGRKLAYTWELAKDHDHWVGIHTGRTNSLVREALEQGILAELKDYGTIQQEVTAVPHSRLDFCLSQEGLPPCHMEVKSVTLRQDEIALFPDAVTTRGKRHLEVLATLRQQGGRSVLLFVVQREDCRLFRPAAAIDGAYAATLRQVAAAGVEVLVYACSVTPQAITLNHALPFELEAA
ncbi:MAG: DNA/RNA nuclease SfsA [Magnetococcales bacterium]|nr:DNA/RNA nuclease SfsA [Magnetococcales bacterium]NGZ27229.1 DNA/RNA nuclease SfsA [Magnetococcales bacterium]